MATLSHFYINRLNAMRCVTGQPKPLRNQLVLMLAAYTKEAPLTKALVKVYVQQYHSTRHVCTCTNNTKL